MPFSRADGNGASPRVANIRLRDGKELMTGARRSNGISTEPISLHAPLQGLAELSS